MHLNVCMCTVLAKKEVLHIREDSEYFGSMPGACLLGCPSLAVLQPAQTNGSLRK